MVKACEICGMPIFDDSHPCTKVKLTQKEIDYIYKLYLLVCEKRNVIAKDKQTFITSSRFQTFVLLYDFIVSNKIKNFDQYISFLIKRRIDYRSWVSHSVYNGFCQHLAEQKNESIDITKSIETIYSLSKHYSLPVNKLLENIPLDYIADLVEQQKISILYVYFSDILRKRLKTERGKGQQRLRNLNPVKHGQLFKLNKQKLFEIQKQRVVQFEQTN